SPIRPTPARLSVRPLRIPAALRQAFQSSHPTSRLLRDAMTFVQPGVKIESATGRAEDKHLRFVEMGRLGAVLEATCRIQVDDELQRPFLSALLMAGAKLIERLGGKRRRGAGECRVDVLVNQVPI